MTTTLRRAPRVGSAPSAARRITTSVRMATLDLVRNRVAMLLLLVIPLVLFGLVYATTGEREVPFQLSTVGETLLTGDERQMSLLFIALTSISGVSAFLGFLLVLGPLGTDARLVLEGYRPAELLLAKLLVMCGVAAVVALYVTALVPLFVRPGRLAGVFAGLLLGSVVYAAFGMALGALVRQELEGMLAILLLVNIDAGWLQNPVFFAHAHQQDLIRLLPAHYPGQVVMVSAFTAADIAQAVAWSILYAAALGAVAALLYGLRVSVRR